MDFKIHEPVMNVRFLAGRFGIEKFCSEFPLLISVALSLEREEWLRTGDLLGIR